MEKREGLQLKTRTVLKKYVEDIDAFDGTVDEFMETFEPYEVREIDGNIALNAGLNALFTLMAGGGGTPFNAANARLAVGEGNAAAAAAQVDLVGPTKTRKAMDGGFPTFGANQKITFRATFGAGDANHAWNEWGVANSAAGATLFNRKVEALGLKAGGVWILSVEITGA